MPYSRRVITRCTRTALLLGAIVLSALAFQPSHAAATRWSAPVGTSEAIAAYPTMYGGAGDSAAVAETIHRFHRALATADSAAVHALLTEDAVILEGGELESRTEYLAHHLPSDIAFARAVERVSGPIRVVVQGDAAWATSTSTTRGSFRDRAVNSQGAELMVLVRTPAGWRIAAIHWSSRPLRT